MKKQVFLFFGIFFVWVSGAWAQEATQEKPPLKLAQPIPAQEEPDPWKQKLTLDYKDADLGNVLRSLSYTYNLNLVTSADVKGKVTITLKEVPVEEALNAILQANGLTYFKKENIVYINPGVPEAANVVSEPVTLQYLKAVDAQVLLRKVLSTKGDIKVDEVSNTMVVTDFPASIVRLRQLLKSIDLPPQQVLVEAKIVDITSKDLDNLGVTWTADWKPAGGVKGIFNRDTRFQEQLKATTTLAGTSSTLSGGQFKLDTLTFKGLSLTATLDALIQDQKAHLLASPSIAVLNNQEARIVIGEKVPFKERTQTTTGTTETTKFIDVGTTLRVTPSINADGYITMRIHPEVSSVSSLLDAGPRITTREADTTVRIKEGETIVIAGLIKQEDNRTKSEIPFLGKIPIVGLLFGSRSKDQTQTELAVFITPRILRTRQELEALGAQVKREEAYVTVEKTGSLGLVSELFQKADSLEKGIGLESRRKPSWVRVEQALNLYRHIASQFPDSPQAAVALFRVASIEAYILRNPAQARDTLELLFALYPSHPIVGQAKELLAQMDEEERFRLQELKRLEEAQRKRREQELRRAEQEAALKRKEEQLREKQEEALRLKQEEELKRLQELEKKRQEKEEAIRRKQERLKAEQERALRLKAEKELKRLQELEKKRKEEDLRRQQELLRKRSQEEKARQQAQRIAEEERRRLESQRRAKEEAKQWAQRTLRRLGAVSEE